MKRILFFVATCLLTLSISAQSFVSGQLSSYSRIRTQRPHTAVTNTPKKIALAPDKALGANQYYCGLYTTDEIAQYGYGYGYYTTGILKAATEFSSSILSNYIGFKVVGMRVGVSEAVEDFGLYIGKIQGGNITDYFSKTVGKGNKGWNTVMFDESEQFVIGASDDYMVGYTYYQNNTPDPDYPGYYTDDCYPISYNTNSEVKGILYIYGNLGSGTSWYSVSSDGALSVQLIVEGELSDQKIVIGSLSTESSFVKSGESLKWSVDVTNMGKNAVSSLGFNLYVDGENIGSATVPVSINATTKASVGSSLSIPSSFSIGSHTLKAELTSIDGAAPVGEIVNNNPTAAFSIYNATTARQKHLIEHITSWTCTYCHLGYKILRKMESDYTDIAWVAIHGNQNSNQDPYFLTENDQIMSYLGLTGFPSASFNRFFIEDLADGDESLAYGLGFNESYLSQVVPYLRGFIDKGAEANPSFVSLNIEQEYNASTRTLDITVKGTGVEQASQLIGDYAMYIYITEAGLTGRQYSNGSWENNFEHNNTLRAILTDVYGDDITWNGDNFTYTKSYDIPSTFNVENLSITAFVAPHPSAGIHNMAVNNCEKVAVNTSATGINSIGNNTSDCEISRYTLDGKLLNAPQKGLNIVKYADGSVKKVMVK